MTRVLITTHTLAGQTLEDNNNFITSVVPQEKYHQGLEQFLRWPNQMAFQSIEHWEAWMFACLDYEAWTWVIVESRFNWVIWNRPR
jgi:hypothetical protein